MKNQIFDNGEIIEVIGNVASGKSTLTKKITKNSNLKYFDIDLFLDNPFLKLVVKDRKRWAFTVGLHFSFQRSQTLKKLIKELKTNSIILDQGYDMGIKVYSKNNFLDDEMNKDEWNLLTNLHDILMRDLPKISTTIFIDVPTDEIMKRISKRGREHEKSYTKDYVENLGLRINEYINDIKKERNTIIIWNPIDKTIKYVGKKDNRFDIFIK